MTAFRSFIPANAFKVYQSDEQLGARMVVCPNFSKRTEPSAEQNCTPLEARVVACIGTKHEDGGVILRLNYRFYSPSGREIA